MNTSRFWQSLTRTRVAITLGPRSLCRIPPAAFQASTPAELSTIPTPWDPRVHTGTSKPESSNLAAPCSKTSFPLLQVSWMHAAKHFSSPCWSWVLRYVRLSSDRVHFEIWYIRLIIFFSQLVYWFPPSTFARCSRQELVDTSLLKTGEQLPTQANR